MRDLTLSAPRRIPRDFASLRRLAWSADDELLVLDYASGVVASRPDGSAAGRWLSELGAQFHDMHLACSGSCVVLVGSVVVRGCRPDDAPADSGFGAWRWQGVRESGWVAGVVGRRNGSAIHRRPGCWVLTAAIVRM